MTQTVPMPHIASEALPRDLLLAKFPKWTLAHWCIMVATASFVILALLPEARLNDFDVPNGGENIRVARSLASHGAFADPFATMPTGTTAHVAPVYPFLYALILRFFGTGYAALLLLWACNVGFLAAQMGLLPLLSHRLHFGILPGIIAASLGTFSLYAPIDTRWEAFFAGLLVLLACLATEHSLNRGSRSATLGAGALWGLSILTNPVLVVLMLAWSLCWILAQPRHHRAMFARRVSIIAVIALFVVSPWIARNHAHFGAFFFVRDNLGLELYTGNNPCASPSIRENIQSGCHARTHPNPNAAIAAQLAAVGEVPFNRAKLHEAFTWMKTHRSAFLSLCMRRFRLFWLPDLDHVWEAILVWLVTLLSLPGLWAMGKKNLVAAELMATAWLLFPLIYYVIQFEPRYRYPIYWTSLLPAACALVEIWRRLPFFHSSPPRCAAS
jgi:hypothetical protein